MKDFIIWMVTKDNKLLQKIKEITGFISEIKENHILIHSSNKQYMDVEMELDIQRVLLRKYIISRIVVLLISAAVVSPIVGALIESKEITGIAAILISYEASRIPEKMVSE